jgi:uncharacterized delta-60 repeat protein
MNLHGIAVIALLAVPTQATFAAPGDFDPTFGDGGVVVVPRFGSLAGPGSSDPTVTYRNVPARVVMQPDKKILLAIEVDQCHPPQPLSASCLPSYIGVMRFNPDGSIDSTFGANGAVTLAGESVSEILVQSDGRIVLDMLGPLLRLQSSGAQDASFGNGGLVTLPFQASGGTLLQQVDGKLLVAGDVPLPDNALGVGILRLNADGSLDSSYGASGVASVPVPDAGGLSPAVALLQGDGKAVIAGTISFLETPAYSSGIFVVRLDTSGKPDAAFGVNGVVTTSFINAPANYSTQPAVAGARLQPDGKLVVTGSLWTLPLDGPVWAQLRLNADGSVDNSFGTLGRVITPLGQVKGNVRWGSSLWTSNGYAVFSGGAALMRLAPDGSLDTGFGNCGARQPDPLGSVIAALQSDDKILVAGVPPGSEYVTSQVALARLLGGHGTSVVVANLGPNPAPTNALITLSASVTGASPITGTVTFMDNGAVIPGCSGVPALPSGIANAGVPSYLANCQVQVIPVGTHVLTANYDGDAANPPAPSCSVVQTVDPPGSVTAVEYYHDVFDHYFVTTLSNEVVALDRGVLPGWRRTGESFRVHPVDQLAASFPVCRFFSGSTFAPESTHFYTPFASECMPLQQNPAWIYEGTLFGLDLPSSAGDCTPGTEPLYRVYNNGMGGAPNHRYLTNMTARDAMVGGDYNNWTAEGFGDGVIACVPGT